MKRFATFLGISFGFPLLVWLFLSWQTPSMFRGDMPFGVWVIIIAIPVGVTLGMFAALLLPNEQHEDLSNRESDKVSIMPIRVVIVDHDLERRSVVERALTGQDYQIWVAEDGKEGLEIAKANQPIIMIIPGEMPGMDGCAVTSQLQREYEATGQPDSVFIFVTLESPSDEQVFRVWSSGKGIVAADYSTEEWKRSLPRVWKYF